MSRRVVSATLPEFPWDTLADVTARARAHPDGIVDLSVGTPVDPVAEVVQNALTAAAPAPGYPATAGTADLRRAMIDALGRRYGVTGLTEAAVLPVGGEVGELRADVHLHALDLEVRILGGGRVGLGGDLERDAKLVLALAGGDLGVGAGVDEFDAVMKRFEEID